MPWVAVAVVAANVIGGMMANNSNKKAQAAADQAIAAARAEIEKVGAPPDQSRVIILDKLKQAGVLTPQMEQNINAGVSQLAEYKESVEGRDAQLNALQLMTRASKEGLGATERADLNKLRTQAAIDAEAKRQQILQSLQARGIAGGGSELASQLSAQQNQYQVASEEGDRMAQQAQARALQAMQQSASAGQSLRGSDLAYAQATKGAADEFKKFDTANQLGVQQRNVGVSNTAQAANLSEKQRIQDTNTQAENEEKYKQLQRERQYWQDKLQYAQALNNPGGGAAADRELAKGKQDAEYKSGMANSVASGIASMYGGGAGGAIGGAKK